MFYFWHLLSRILRINRFRYRRLTSGEIALCRRVYADLIDYEQVRIMNHPFLPWQSVHVFMAPCGDIHARAHHYCEDYSRRSLGYQAVFIHEMAHVYQHQKNINVLGKGAYLQAAYFLSFKKYDPYAYTLKADKKFFDYNIEQQGDIAKDIFLGKIPNIILNAHILKK
ncbi:hypothetical protein G9F31_10945 [Acinetobacter sp. 187]|uniref:Type IV secretion protein Rhs n=1 Tax=Acinetobacter lanii TaxID=2715163 RepID=A0A6G8S5S0_9GAMM|nr:hypothetical protein [Acinetobacter lanii]NHC04280.1 hypothetical protein [Acinetobacter lanii]QIO09507.1 hypothetical protein G8D99_11095 [Acinetobacter lanii]